MAALSEAPLSELKISISVDHRIRGMLIVSLKFLKMAIVEMFKRPSRGKSDLNFFIEMRLKDRPKDIGSLLPGKNF